MSQPRRHSLQEDEELARMLQYQEHASVSSFNFDSRDSMRQRTRSFDVSPPEMSLEARRGKQRSSLRAAANGPESMQDTLAYVRQLQEQAFHNLDDQRSARGSPDSNALEASDMELAWKMQELEISASNNGSSKFDFGYQRSGIFAGINPDDLRSGSTSASASSGSIKITRDDERLARHLETTGTSMKDLSAADFSAIYEGTPSSRATMQGSTNTLETIDRQIAFTRMHVTPPSSTTTSPMISAKVPVISAKLAASRDRLRNARLTQSAKPSCDHRPRVQPHLRATNATTHTAPLSASAIPTGHVNGYGLPTLDPLYTVDSVDAESGKPRSARKKRGSFLRFGSKKASAADAAKIAMAAMDIGDIPPPDAHSSFSSLGTTNGANFGQTTPRAVQVSPRPHGGTSRSWLPRSPKREKRSTATNATINTVPEQIPLPNHATTSDSYSKSAIAATRSRDMVCTSCGQMQGAFIVAMDRPYHPHCFRCGTCRQHIDPSTPFVTTTTESGQKRAHHPHCYADISALRCTVCDDQIPATTDGIVPFVKHPFFENEVMCLRHADNPGRRCTGCQRFEPDNAPFADLNDNGRCVCYACCRSVIVDSADINPLWVKIMHFFEKHLNLPVWDAMRNIPLVVVRSAEMEEAIIQSKSPHKGHSQNVTRGCSLTNFDSSSGRLARAPSLRFERSSLSFRSIDADDGGFTYFEMPIESKGNSNSQVHAILCLSGLPSDLTASVLAHEATHAWLKLHPKYDYRKPLPPKVEEGCAQLMSMLLLSEGLDPFHSNDAVDVGPSDEKLRQYFQYCIEREESDVFGEGYRCAAAAYRDIGIEALLDHVVRYRDIPST
ncbi:hypothetical protein MPSEU_000292200 [Mayamaea pseudoterrestris]|nr:hypothetical protein MPSEU_000292200 [Mayamaea pseudoterrestris]